MYRQNGYCVVSVQALQNHNTKTTYKTNLSGRPNMKNWKNATSSCYPYLAVA